MKNKQRVPAPRGRQSDDLAAYEVGSGRISLRCASMTRKLVPNILGIWGMSVQPHVHNPVPREVQFTEEALFIRKGRLRVDFYDADQRYLESRILGPGDGAVPNTNRRAASRRHPLRRRWHVRSCPSGYIFPRGMDSRNSG